MLIFPRISSSKIHLVFEMKILMIALCKIFALILNFYQEHVDSKSLDLKINCIIVSMILG